MFFDPFGTLVNLFLGLKKLKEAEAHARLGLAIWGTVLVTFLGTWGTSIAAMYSTLGAVGSLVLGFAAACIASATAVTVLWKRSSLTKDLPLVIPGEIANKVITESFEYSEGKK